MLKREVYGDPFEWKNRDHKCLPISGQRQVGKTIIVREFVSKEYQYLAELNFASMENASKIFEGDNVLTGGNGTYLGGLL